MKTLLVIDMLEDFFRKDPLKSIREKLVTNINTLTEQFRKNDVPIIWIRQEFKEDLSDAYLVMKKENIRITIAGTVGCEILPELLKTSSEHEIIKKRYSAFYGTELDELLNELGTTELILAGVNTHACIRSTAIDAYQRDLEITIPIECVASYDQEHHDVTLRYLGGRIAKIVALDAVWNDGTL